MIWSPCLEIIRPSCFNQEPAFIRFGFVRLHFLWFPRHELKNKREIKLKEAPFWIWLAGWQISNLVHPASYEDHPYTINRRHPRWINGTVGRIAPGVLMSYSWLRIKAKSQGSREPIWVLRSIRWRSSEWIGGSGAGTDAFTRWDMYHI